MFTLVLIPVASSLFWLKMSVGVQWQVGNHSLQNNSNTATGDEGEVVRGDAIGSEVSKPVREPVSKSLVKWPRANDSMNEK